MDEADDKSIIRNQEGESCWRILYQLTLNKYIVHHCTRLAEKYNRIVAHLMRIHLNFYRVYKLGDDLSYLQFQEIGAFLCAFEQVHNLQAEILHAFLKQSEEHPVGAGGVGCPMNRQCHNVKPKGQLRFSKGADGWDYDLAHRETLPTCGLEGLLSLLKKWCRQSESWCAQKPKLIQYFLKSLLKALKVRRHT